jgi:hypothetical protein
LADLAGLADMHRSVDEQEQEMKALELKIQKQKDVLARLAHEQAVEKADVDMG